MSKTLREIAKPVIRDFRITANDGKSYHAKHAKFMASNAVYYKLESVLNRYDFKR